MIVTRQVRAEQAAVWDVLTRVEAWPSLTPSMTSVEIVGGGPLRPGAQARIAQPRTPPLTWTVTAYEEGWSFSWQATVAGVTTLASHRVEPSGTGTLLTLGVTQTGLLALPVRLLTGRRTAAYVAREADGLQAAAER